MIYFFVIVAVVIGSLMPVQAGLNAQLTQIFRHPYLGAFLSLLTGAIAMVVLVVAQGIGFQELRRLGEVPPHLFLGGILGAVFVGSSLFLIPRMGATPMVAAFITGQLVGSVLIDHFGFFGLSVTSINLQRMVGVFLLFCGLFLVIKKSS